ncbi:hypothetical protein EOD39_6635 [Acipenser ruthenus]|uniref:Uncharacterized protein n=1 Tax=Acipenser ruthenus TaxID=7906 RepID=A0A444U9I8_ACIRT|nr:hypothetical protein EOD39_6635 [Acipenser ruthenus]
MELFLLNLLWERSEPPALHVPLGPHGAASSDWPQADILSIGASEEVSEQELTFPSEDGTFPALKHSLFSKAHTAYKRTTATLQVPWPIATETRQSISDDEPTTSPISLPVHPDFLCEMQSSWDDPATAPAVSRTTDALYRGQDAEKLGLAHFPPVEASIAVLVQVPNLVLLSKDAACPKKQCQVSEVILKRAYSVGAKGITTASW